MNEARIQISKKAADGDLLNIRADSYEELAGALPALQAMPELTKYFAVDNATAGLGATVEAAPATDLPGVPYAAPAAPVQQPPAVAFQAPPGQPVAQQAAPQGQPDPAQYGQPCNKVLPSGTICQGTKTKLVPAGTSKTGKAYPAFFGCPNDHRG